LRPLFGFGDQKYTPSVTRFAPGRWPVEDIGAPSGGASHFTRALQAIGVSSLARRRSARVSLLLMKNLLLSAIVVIATAMSTYAQAGKEKGEAFLAENAKKEGVKTTASGLQYKMVKEGTGKQPTAADTVKVHYRGTLIDGKEFDSSYARKQPIEFPLNGVIKGWTEGLQLMKEGGKCLLYIPSALAYGKRGAGDLIGPDETLVFEVELLEVK
jgi:FKBP-type peptidyl-prolyl cis-trans isomerase